MKSEERPSFTLIIKHICIFGLYQTQSIMKNLILTILLALFASTCLAQTDQMKFKGIPMGVDIKSFTRSLQLKGYTLLEIADGTALLKGEFGGYKYSTIFVEAGSDGAVHTTLVVLPSRERGSICIVTTTILREC